MYMTNKWFNTLLDINILLISTLHMSVGYPLYWSPGIFEAFLSYLHIILFLFLYYLFEDNGFACTLLLCLSLLLMILVLVLYNLFLQEERTKIIFLCLTVHFLFRQECFNKIMAFLFPQIPKMKFWIILCHSNSIIFPFLTIATSFKTHRSLYQIMATVAYK